MLCETVACETVVEETVVKFSVIEDRLVVAFTVDISTVFFLCQISPAASLAIGACRRVICRLKE